jgi:hypothetical protein
MLRHKQHINTEFITFRILFDANMYKKDNLYINM